jgi:hypothetical protein
VRAAAVAIDRFLVSFISAVGAGGSSGRGVGQLSRGPVKSVLLDPRPHPSRAPRLLRTATPVYIGNDIANIPPPNGLMKESEPLPPSTICMFLLFLFSLSLSLLDFP